MKTLVGLQVIMVGFAGLLATAGSGAEPRLLDPAQVALEFDQRSWQHEHGLPPGDRIWAILQTRDGYLWIGTQDGLARFDGRNFTVFNHVNAPELASDDCRTLAEDREGNLWIGTEQRLVRKSGNRFTVFAPKLGAEARGRPPMCASRAGGVWVGGMTGVCLVSNDVVRIYPQEPPDVLGPGVVTSVEETEAGHVWVGTKTGFGRLNAVSGRYENFSKESRFEGRPVVAMRGNPGGGLWIQFMEYEGHEGSWNPRSWLAWLEPGGWPKAPVERQHWLAHGAFLLPRQGGVLWLPGSSRGEIRRYRNGEVELLPILRRHEEDFTLSAFVDHESNLWIGTERSGLQRWAPRESSALTSREGLAHDNTWSICEAGDGAVWIGTDGGVTQFKNGRCTTLKRPDGTVHQDVRAVAEDRDGALWIGPMRTLECVREGISSPVHFPGEWFEEKIRALLPGRDGSMWIGTVRGLTRLHRDERTKYTRAEGLGSDEVRAILENRAGDLWVGTFQGGLSRLHDGRFTTLTTTNGLTSNNVWALHEDSDGVLWVGTDNGLNRIEGGQITKITKAQGLPDPLINSIASDDSGRLWIGHDRGVYSLQRQEVQELARRHRATVTAAKYDESDGLPSVETNGQKSNPAVCKTRDGRVWFPTTRGVAIIDPEKVGVGRVAPLAAIEEVHTNGRQIWGNTPEVRSPDGLDPIPWARGPDLELPPGGARVIEFHFTANTFVAPEKARFKYRLVGLDDHWIDAGTRRQASFTDLRPGDYRFEVVAGNHHGFWQERGTTMAFHLAPFYYQTWWFYSICGVCILGLAGLAIGWRVRELRKIYELQRLNALNEQRRQIARDIHDEVGASLTHILRLSDPAQTPTGEGASPPAERIASIAGEAVDSIGEIVWANNPDYDTLEDLAAYLREHAASYFADSAIQVRLEFPQTVPATKVTGLFRRHVVMLLKEALQNVSKHAEASCVNVRLSMRRGSLELSVADDGRGFSVSGSRSAGNGLMHMRQRVAELGGTCSIESTPENGTRIQAILPLANC